MCIYKRLINYMHIFNPTAIWDRLFSAFSPAVLYIRMCIRLCGCWLFYGTHTNAVICGLCWPTRIWRRFSFARASFFVFFSFSLKNKKGTVIRWRMFVSRKGTQTKQWIGKGRKGCSLFQRYVTLVHHSLDCLTVMGNSWAKSLYSGFRLVYYIFS